MDRIWAKQYDPRVPVTLSYPDLTLPEVLAEAAMHYPDRPAIRYYGRGIRYHELDQLANRFANALISLKVRKASVVGLMLPNLPQTVIGYYGSLRAGAIVTPMNPLYVQPEIERQVNDSGCEVLLALDQFYPRIEPLIGRTPLKHVILTGVEDFLPWVKRLLYPLKAMRQGHRRKRKLGPNTYLLNHLLRTTVEPPKVPMHQDEIAVLQYTGGTTGTPKGVVLTHRNLVCNMWQCRQWMPSLREGSEVFLAVLPFFHVYGISVCLNLAIAVGGSLVLLPRFQISEVLDAIEREHITAFPGIPAMYAAINNHQQLERYNLRSIRLCISGAGPLHPSVQKRFESLTGAQLAEGYGLTEAGPVTHVNPVDHTSGLRRGRSIGLPLPDTDAKIVDPESGDRELPIGQIGELVVHGPQVMRGYWKREEETAQVLRKGWLYTGDLARMDEEGFFYIEDRKKDMIKSGGENVYPREIEEVLVQHSKIKEAVVVGIPQQLRGELIKAYVVLHEGESATTGELLDYCRSQLAKFKVPKRVEFRTQLPKTLVGKVLRRVLVEEERAKRGAESEH
ncbi:MAG: long-chain fatty acid--CoA ligase [Nitrospiraceae bacterium]